MDENLRAITDGRFYEKNDMVRVGCHDCHGCSSCCEDMGTSILLDPYDIYRLTDNMGLSFEELMEGPVELHVEEGLILPNIRMVARAGKSPACGFLSENGRCRIHAFRPGLCRLFPLGRNYDGEHLNYFLLAHACPAPNKTKMKVSKWLMQEQSKEYEQFLVAWHTFTKQLRQKLLCEMQRESEQGQRLTLKFLQLFYMTPYESGDFFREFAGRLEQAKQYFL